MYKKKLRKNPNIIIHLAAKTEEKSLLSYKLSQVNYSGTVNLIECSKNLKTLKILYLVALWKRMDFNLFQMKLKN